MSLVSNVERDFLKAIGLEFISSNNHDTIVTSDGKTLKYSGNSKTKTSKYYDFSGGDILLRFGFKDYTGKTIGVETQSYRYEFSEYIRQDKSKIISVTLYDNRESSRNYMIEVVPQFDAPEDQRYLITYIRDSKKFLEPCCIDCTLFTVKGTEVGALQQRDSFGPEELSGANYESILKEMIDAMYIDNNRAKNFFLWLVPFFRLVFDKYQKVPTSYVQSYLGKIEKERDSINREADRKIGEINAQRQQKLEKNNAQYEVIKARVENQEKQRRR